MFCIFPAHGKISLKWPQMGPGVFFLLIWTLPTFWAERIWILRICIFIFFLDPKFQDFQVPDFQTSRNLAWASLGLGRAWANSSGLANIGEVRLMKIVAVQVEAVVIMLEP